MVSVIVPMFQVEDYIGQTIQSLRSQTLSDLEFILVDDGSADDTVARATEAIGDDQLFRLQKRTNHGPSASRNFGLNLAKGRYVCFLDSDDLLPADGLELMVEAAESLQAELVTGTTLRFDGTKQWPVPLYTNYGVTHPGVKTLTTHPELMLALGPAAKLYSRDLLRGITFPEHIRLGEDQPFVLEALMRAKKIVTIDGVVYHYRVRESQGESLTQKAISDPLPALADLYEMVEIARGILTDPTLFRYYLSRVVAFDIWPRVRAGIKSGDGEVQSRAMESLSIWLNQFDAQGFARDFDPGLRVWLGVTRHRAQILPGAQEEACRLKSVAKALATPAGYLHFLGSGLRHLNRRGSRG
jgi:glycosyltransferase involved in cell wall biosynthesis